MPENFKKKYRSLFRLHTLNEFMRSSFLQICKPKITKQTRIIGKKPAYTQKKIAEKSAMILVCLAGQKFLVCIFGETDRAETPHNFVCILGETMTSKIHSEIISPLSSTETAFFFLKMIYPSFRYLVHILTMYFSIPECEG